MSYDSGLMVGIFDSWVSSGNSCEDELDYYITVSINSTLRVEIAE